MMLRGARGFGDIREVEMKALTLNSPFFLVFNLLRVIVVREGFYNKKTGDVMLRKGILLFTAIFCLSFSAFAGDTITADQTPSANTPQVQTQDSNSQNDAPSVQDIPGRELTIEDFPLSLGEGIIQLKGYPAPPPLSADSVEERKPAGPDDTGTNK